MPLEYVTLIGFGIVLLVAGYALGRRSAHLDSLAGQYTRPKPKPRFIPKWLYFQTTPDWRAGFWQGLSTEMIGGIITAVLLGFVITLAQRAESERSLKQQLILQMGSPDNGFAVEAARQLDALGWLQDGSLQGAYLSSANLAGVDLSYAKMEGAFLQEVDLREANMRSANLQDVLLDYANLAGANLSNANLVGTYLFDTVFDENTILPDMSHWTLDTDIARFTNPNHPNFWQGFGLAGLNLSNRNLANADLQGVILQGANLEAIDMQSANLEDASLFEANLQSTNLMGANLQSAQLQNANLEAANLENADLRSANLNGANLVYADLAGAKFDETTTLPDRRANGQMIQWTTDTDMTRFTDPNHPDFWRSDNPNSPAYRGDE